MGVELFHDIGAVSPHGYQTDIQTVSDRLVAFTFRYQLIEASSPLNAKKSLKTAIRAIQSVADEISTICNNLRPPLLDDIGISAAISWWCREFQTLFGIRAQVRTEGDAIRLFIEDDGIGFTLPVRRSRKAPREGFGLASRRERVEDSGGAFLIKPGELAGTVIEASWAVRP